MGSVAGVAKHSKVQRQAVKIAAAEEYLVIGFSKIRCSETGMPVKEYTSPPALMTSPIRSLSSDPNPQALRPFHQVSPRQRPAPVPGTTKVLLSTPSSPPSEPFAEPARQPDCTVPAS